MTLSEVLVNAAGLLPDVVTGADSGNGRTWAVRGVIFATLAADGSSASFLLDPIVAGAAARTRDVSASPRGPGWVEIRPLVVDGHAADRATAWFLSGHRRLTGPGA